MTDREIEKDRYTKCGVLFLDHDDGGYTNSYVIKDRGKETGITLSATGHSRHKDSHKESVDFNGAAYPNLRAAIYAYEDATP
jgi:hypothetical protein